MNNFVWTKVIDISEKQVWKYELYLIEVSVRNCHSMIFCDRLRPNPFNLKYTPTIWQIPKNIKNDDGIIGLSLGNADTWHMILPHLIKLKVLTKIQQS